MGSQCIFIQYFPQLSRFEKPVLGCHFFGPVLCNLRRCCSCPGGYWHFNWWPLKTVCHKTDLTQSGCRRTSFQKKSVVKSNYIISCFQAFSPCSVRSVGAVLRGKSSNCFSRKYFIYCLCIFINRVNSVKAPLREKPRLSSRRVSHLNWMNYSTVTVTVENPSSGLSTGSVCAVLPPSLKWVLCWCCI